MKIHIKTLLTLITLGFLIQGIFEFKHFLKLNFIDNDTKMKEGLNRALNGELPKKKGSIE